VAGAFAHNPENFALTSFLPVLRLARKVSFWLMQSSRIRPEVSMNESREQFRIQPVDPAHSTGTIGRAFTELRAKFALVPNLFRVLANAPVALEGLGGLSTALAGGTLNQKTREQLALAIAESNLCEYCLSMHTTVAAKIGLSKMEIDEAMRACAAEARTDAILKLARSIVVQRGELTDADLARAHAAGLSDGEIVETVAHVALNIFENYLSHLARVPIDVAQPKSAESPSQGGESNGEH
jgi:uncharacterized peroxidase-related enzyme